MVLGILVSILQASRPLVREPSVAQGGKSPLTEAKPMAPPHLKGDCPHKSMARRAFWCLDVRRREEAD